MQTISQIANFLLTFVAICDTIISHKVKITRTYHRIAPFSERNIKMTTGYEEKKFNINMTDDAIYAARAAERAARRAAAEAKRRATDMCILISVAAIALIVFIVCGTAAAASRGFVFGIGGEAILGLAVVFGLFRLWKKIKKHLN